MTDVALLELARRIVIQHEEREDHTMRVVPVVDDALEVDRGALLAIVSRYEGVYLYCDSTPCEDARARGPLNSSLAQHLTQLCAQRKLELDITEHDDEVVVTAPRHPELNAALAVVARVIAALVSDEINEPLAVLSYPLAGLDEERATLLWDATLAVANFPPPRLRTLVPIAGGRVNVDRHCNRNEGSVRLVVRDGELIERGSPLAAATTMSMILDSIERPLVLFLGAGASAAAGIPQGNWVRDRALAALTDKPVSSPGLIDAFREWLTVQDRWMAGERDLKSRAFERNLTLERVLREEFYKLSGRPRSDSGTVQRLQADCVAALDWQPPGRQALWELVAKLPRLVIATVNFDQLIEDGMNEPHEVIIGDAAFDQHRDLVLQRLRGEADRVPILKLHGTIEDPDSLVADINETSRGLPGQIAATLDAMIAEAGCLTWVWIGCSMRDADLNAWLAGKNGGDADGNKTEIQEWWVDPLPPATLTAYAHRWRAKQWASIDQTLKSRVITETSDRWLPALLEHVEQLRGPSTS